MKILMCDNCNKQQQSGKYCLDCGQPLKEIYTDNVQFKSIKTKRTAYQLKEDVRNWLGRIGVQQTDIKINTANGIARIEYSLKNTVYSFSSHLQDNITNNLAAVELFLHNRVIGIERGIETAEQAFAGYEALPDYTSQSGSFNAYEALGFKEPVDIEVAKKKYKLLIKKYHPDVNPDKDTHEEFQRIKKAIDELESRK